MILDNLSSILAGLIILSILGAAAFAQARKKKSGAGCGMACSACQGCPGAQKTQEYKH